jgi:hypothetical protein
MLIFLCSSKLLRESLRRGVAVSTRVLLVKCFLLKQSPEVRSTPIVIGQLLWQPFEIRFDDFLRRLESYDEIMRAEQTFLQTKTIIDLSEAQMEERERMTDSDFSEPPRPVSCKALYSSIPQIN